jgi:DNA polymerase I-like protein with 3'-5' exonuclease and polymerase domains
LKLNDLAVGADGRNRCLLSGFGTKTARNAPSNSKFIFGPARWLRFYITPPLGRVVIHRDYKQQEPRIAALQSGDANLLAACESADLYLGMADQLGFLRESMNEIELEGLRSLFKIVVLGILYGLCARSLAEKTGVSLYEAEEILLKMRLRFSRFEDYVTAVLDHAGLEDMVMTDGGWYLQCPPGSNERTIRNFRVQATGSHILHTDSILAERRGLEIIAPVHDALMFEGDLADAVELERATDRLMRDASATVLGGYELPSDCQIIRPGDHYEEKKGRAMWETVNRLLDKRKRIIA